MVKPQVVSSDPFSENQALLSLLKNAFKHVGNGYSSDSMVKSVALLTSDPQPHVQSLAWAECLQPTHAVQPSFSWRKNGCQLQLE